MPDPTLFQRVKTVLIAELGIHNPDLVTLDASLVEDLAMDSLDIVEVEVALEDELGVEFPNTDTPDPGLRTVQDLVSLVEKLADE